MDKKKKNGIAATTTTTTTITSGSTSTSSSAPTTTTTTIDDRSRTKSGADALLEARTARLGPSGSDHNGDEAKASEPPSGEKNGTPSKNAHAHDDPNKQGGSQKKRRKVTHACVYCRRSHMTCDLERPCTRCIKRNIGHLCHDEPRENDSKKPTGRASTAAGSTLDESESQQSQSDKALSVLDQASAAVAAAVGMAPSSFEGVAGPAPAPVSAAAGSGGGGGITVRGPVSSLSRSRSTPQLVRPTQLPGIQANSLRNSHLNLIGYSNALFDAQSHLQGMPDFPNNFLIAGEFSNEYNLINEFLNSSLGEDEEMLPGGYLGQQSSNPLLPPNAVSGEPGLLPQSQQHQQSQQTQSSNNADNGIPLARPLTTGNPEDGNRSQPPTAEFYLQVADPSGNDTPEARMSRVLQAKYDAGLLKPFNYILGYKKLQDYLETHIAPSSKQKILAQINRFRPKFREKIQKIGDIQLVYVEMWFEKTLMEYDRVFASMAVPACCWRRTGEIFRGNHEMAELIGVDSERLRDGKVALHEILTETSMVRYWEEFGTIAFDAAHDTLLTACVLKSLDGSAKEIKCCFSLKIRRDEYKIPSLIVGNFLPHDPSH